MQKGRKSIMKRIRVTKTGKLIARKRGQSHFRSKKSGQNKMGKRSTVNLGKENIRRILTRA
jgi:ribosomal protein L35